MKALLVATLAGGLFGLGLSVSQMANPAKVLAFLDLGGAWDPSLALVMAAALTVSAAGVALARRRTAPWCAERFPEAPAPVVDVRLVGGAALFGVGWGLAGYCPGPALVALGFGTTEGAVFVAAMLLGLWLAAPRNRAAAAPAPS